MSGPFGSSPWGYNSGGSFYPYSIDQSLRLDGTSAYLTKNDFATSTDTSKRTFSTWVKRGEPVGVAGYNHIISAGSTGIDGFGFANGTAKLQWVQGGVVTKDGVRDLRDTSAWYHIFTTWNATDNEVYIYVNGELDYSSTGSIDPLSKLGNTGHTTYIGKRSNAATYIDGYLAETVFLDGYIGDVNDFGELVNGIWVPKDISAASLTYGTNGFYLDYADSSDFGKDVSGQNNHFTSNSLAAEDQVPDSPTNGFATLNALRTVGSPNRTQGNLEAQDASTACGDSTFHIPKTGKWYFESMTAVGGGVRQGVGDYSVTFGVNNFLPVGGGTGSYLWQENATSVSINGSTGSATGGGTSAFTANPGVGTPVGVTVDVENLEIYFQADVGSGLEVLGPFSINSAHTNLSPAFNMNGDTVSFNFGADSSFAGRKTSGSAEAQDANGRGDFYYTPPTGALALCTSNLPEPVIGPNSDTTSDEHFNTVLYTGTGAAQSITGVGFQPDFTWIKNRSAAQHHNLFDVIRGAGKLLYSSLSNAEATTSTHLNSFDSDGFTVGSAVSANGSGNAIASWNWKAGGTASSIAVDAYSAGVPSIASSVSANQDAGFSIVSWTGTGAAGTIGHGLSSAPEHIIVKNRDTAGRIWLNYVKAAVSDAETDYLSLNGTGALVDNVDVWNDTAPTSTVFTVGLNASANQSGNDMIAYCFHGVEGYSKFGAYVGNGSADGTFVYTGFRPAWVMIKKSSGTDGWSIYDSARETINVMDTRLSANLSDAEVSSSNIELDFISNGFKLRGTGSTINTSGQTYIYLAFAEAPFKYANAR